MIQLRLRADVGLEGIQGGDHVHVDPDSPDEFVLWRPHSWPDSETDRIREVLRKAILGGRMTILTPDITQAEALRILGSSLRLVR